jgi:hypothetical protein
MLEEIRREKRAKKKNNKESHLVHPIPIKEMSGKKIKAIQKENEIRKAVIRTQRWRLRIKLQKDNTDKQPTVPEKNTYNSRSKYDREKKEQSALQLASQPNKSWECKDVFLQKMKPNIDEPISSNRLLYYFFEKLLALENC